MSSDLADFVAGTPGRFVPDEMRGELVEVEHLVRYWWAARIARGRRTLDAGCGLGYGAAMLADAGARSVAAVDVGEAVVEAARARVPEGVTCHVGDIRELAFDDDAFELIVCFEVIEHVDEQDRALDELRRVLAPGGLLAISSPNREVYVPGNPHHVHEYVPDELEAALLHRWANVRLLRQHNFVASALLADETARVGGGQELKSAELRKLAPKVPGEEVYTIALAGDGDLPPATDLVALASPVEVRRWLERFEDQQRVLEQQADLLTELQRQREQHAAALARLEGAETAFAAVVALEARLEASENARRALAGQMDGLLQDHAERAERAEVALRRVESSRSWRLTRPLRAAKRRLR
jgi:SAM-dependent methyltransferase